MYMAYVKNGMERSGNVSRTWLKDLTKSIIFISDSSSLAGTHILIEMGVNFPVAMHSVRNYYETAMSVLITLKL